MKTILETNLANDFLTQYKRLLADIAGKPLTQTEDYVQARDALYADDFNQTYELPKECKADFVDAIRNAKYGTYIYAKKYKQGYAFKGMDNEWAFAAVLTTPLEEMIPDWVIVETALLPIYGQVVCDGLVINRHISIGKNMIHEMIQELKVARSRASSNQINRSD